MGGARRNYPDTKLATRYSKELAVVVERDKARFSAWYELFPRSCAAEPGRHGTFADCERCLPQIAKMGFDSALFPPIHPIGRTHRKGKNNVAVPACPTIPAVRGRSARRKAATNQFTQIWARSTTILNSLISKAEPLRHRNRTGPRFSMQSDHPYVRNIPNGFVGVRMEPSSMPRIRRKNMKIFIHSISPRAMAGIVA